ncbi:V-type ATPase, V0 complex, 116kDa subunit family [Umbelopsis sp. PMI_123]|nr:V-type ATPase, V0 complex, 116kDa subunit family [Umbelopsis sp. PMI_123]
MSESTLFRSEEMSLVQLYIPSEIAQPTVTELGELGLVQFRDLNPDVNAFQRSFVSEIRRLDEMERQCRFFEKQLEKSEIHARTLTTATYFARARSAQEIDDLEERLREHEVRILQMNNSHEKLQRKYLQLTELRHVLRETAVFFEQAESRQDSIRNLFDNQDNDTAPLLERDVEQANFDGTGLNLGYVTGVISKERLPTFQRVLWRSLRGNLYMNSAEIDEPITDPVTDEVLEKNVFIIFAHGKEIISKIKKISESLGGTIYSVDESPDKRRDELLEVTSRIEDLHNVLSNTNQTRRAELLKISENLTAWFTIVKKEKAIYHAMNLFNYDATRKCLIAEGWCATRDIPVIQNALRTATESSGSNVSSILTELRTRKKPPTFHRTNKFTEGFQSIIDAYGIARYREVNPGLFTLITFPFLFAVMFGDTGHGFLMLIFALYLVLNEKKLARQEQDEIFSMFFYGRYIILLMSIFSLYTGALYNDVFSQSLTLWKTGFAWPSNFTTGQTVEAIPLNQTYPFGLDPTWHGADNSLLFTNSYKMKQAIIIGVVHMSFAICLNIFNHIYYGNKMFVWLEFLPQILFMEVIFGYLICLILYKWSVNWWELDANGNHIRNSPPSLLNTLIYMFLQPGYVDPKDQLFPGQGPLQMFLILIAVVCVPWMLLGKPYYLKAQHSKHQYETVAGDEDVAYEDEQDATTSTNEHHAIDDEEEEEFDFSEEMIHQSIHTIEFCLNCISNTASYLRLWALSLAHAQLSTVLWEMTLKIWFYYSGTVAVVGLVFGFALWFCLTCAILLGMEGLSAFLHALRLHWVEFAGKHYLGDGYKFEPFSFAQALSTKD